VVTIPGSGERFDLDRPGAVAAWNRALNRRYGMENLRAHPNPVVRWIEARRRSRIGALVGTGFRRALDVGAEDGSLAATWRDAERGFTLLLDLDPRMLRRAAGSPAVAADASRLPLKSSSFDVIVLSAVLEHVVDALACVEEAARVLRPRGRIVAYVPWDRAVVGIKRWARRCRLPLGRLHEGPAPGHLRCFDRSALERLFRPVARRKLSIELDPLSLGYYVEAILA
jgi:SAM-dependent methyltransferase